MVSVTGYRYECLYSASYSTPTTRAAGLCALGGTTHPQPRRAGQVRSRSVELSVELVLGDTAREPETRYCTVYLAIYDDSKCDSKSTFLAAFSIALIVPINGHAMYKALSKGAVQPSALAVWANKRSAKATGGSVLMTLDNRAQSVQRSPTSRSKYKEAAIALPLQRSIARSTIDRMVQTTV